MNVRWDCVVTDTTFPFSRRMPDAAPAAGASNGPVEVRVRLFGMLGGRDDTHPLILQFASGCALRDVIDELGRRLGRDFLRNVVSESGESFNTCRLFLDGEPVHDMSTPIRGGPAAASVEIILFREIEGG